MLPMSDIAEVIDPVRRQRYRFDRDGDDLVAEVWTDVGGDVPEHAHPRQIEWWEVVTGEVTFLIDGERRPAAPGDHIRADAGVRHAFVNDGSRPALLRVRVSPAGDLEAFLHEAARLARTGAFDARGRPSSPRAALNLLALATRHRRDIVITAPPAARLFSAALQALP